MRSLLLCNWIGNWDTLCLLCSRRWNFCPFATYILKHIVSVRAVTMQLDTFCLVVSSRRCDTFLKGPSLTFLSAPDHLLDKIVSKKPRNSFCPVTHFCFIALSRTTQDLPSYILLLCIYSSYQLVTLASNYFPL